MRQNTPRRWFSGTMVAGLFVAAVMTGSNPAAADGLPVKKNDFHLTEYVTEGVTALTQDQVMKDNLVGNAQTGGAGNNGGTGGTVTAGGQQGSGVQQTSGTVTAGVQQGAVGQQTGGTVTAGGQQGTAGQNTAGTVTAGVQQGSGSQNTAGTVTAGQHGIPQGNSQQAGAPGGSQNGSGSSTVVAGGGKRTASGPSVLTEIITEGEKGMPSESILGGATLTMLNSQTNSQILSAIIQTSQGKLIVIDGGLGEDGDYLLSQIQARGGHVGAWLLTHPHGDHVGAIYKILQDGAPGIQIDGIYYNFAAPEWYPIHDPDEQTMALSLIGTFAGLPQNILHQVSRNQFIQVDDVIIQVMNDRYDLSEDKGNNASIVYKLLVNGKTMLFLGDLGEAGGRRLLAEAGAEQLKVDIVQMAHHGQNGVGEEVYRAINPSICLWPTPQWLWNHDGSKWPIAETKAWMSRLGVQKHYVMKDGDQVLR